MTPSLRWPALRSLHSKECEHGGGNIVVVKLLLPPLSRLHSRWLKLILKLKVMSLQWIGEYILCTAGLSCLAILGIMLAHVRAEEELSIEQLDSNHSKDELERRNVVIGIDIVDSYLEQDVNN